MRIRVATVLSGFSIALVGAAPASAATFVVTKTADTKGTCSVNDCSLRAAVIAANANDEGDVILVPPGEYTLTGAPNEDAAQSGDLDSTDKNDALLIDGAGAGAGGTTVSGGGNGRIFDVFHMAQLELREMRIVDGFSAQGGAIRNYGGELLIRDSVLEGNESGGGGAILSSGIGRPRVVIENSTLTRNAAGAGGAIHNARESRLVLTGSTVTENTAGLRGGAISNQDIGTATIVDSLISGNVSAQSGGGIVTENESSLTIVRSTIASNQTSFEEGGAVWAQNSSTVTIVDSTLSDNESFSTVINSGGGAIWARHDVAVTISGSTLDGNAAGTHGGGIFVRDSVLLTLRNSTVTGNAARDHGGGIYAEGEPVVQIADSTIAGNTASAGGGLFDATVSPSAPFRLRGTIVAANAGEESLDDCAGDVAGGAYASFGFNLDTSGTCDLSAAGDVPNGYAALAPLAANGGPTRTLALRAGSQAIDAGGAACPASDQRGAPRPQGAACDIGAFEASPPPAPPPVETPTPAEPTPPPADTVPPSARLLGRKAQDLGKRVALHVRCKGSDVCLAKATGSLRIEGSGKALPLRPSQRVLIRPGGRAMLNLRLPRGVRSRAAAALLDGQRVEALVDVRVADEAGNERLIQRTLHLG